MNKTRIKSVIQVLTAALLSGLSVPVSRLLLNRIEPVLMSALLSLGSAIGLLILVFFRRLLRIPYNAGPALQRPDLPWLAGSIIFGGILAPLILMYSLRATPPATASLLLNFESVATALIAATLFHESVGRRAVLAIIFITAGSIWLTLDAAGGWGISAGAIGILGTASLWGLDNNMTRKIAARDSLTIGWVKGLVSGAFSFALALVLHNAFPDFAITLAALAVGAVSYGVGLALFIMALGTLGAARSSAIFGTASFWGAIASFIIFREIQWTVLIWLPLMAAGMYILLGEREA